MSDAATRDFMDEVIGSDKDNGNVIISPSLSSCASSSLIQLHTIEVGEFGPLKQSVNYEEPPTRVKGKKSVQNPAQLQALTEKKLQILSSFSSYEFSNPDPKPRVPTLAELERLQPSGGGGKNYVATLVKIQTFAKRSKGFLHELMSAQSSDRTKDILYENAKLLTNDMGNYVMTEGLRLAWMKKTNEMYKMSEIGVIIWSIMEFNKLTNNPQESVNLFYGRMNDPNAYDYRRMYGIAVNHLQKRFRLNARYVLKQRIITEREGIDPKMTFEILPVSLKRCFVFRDRELLETTLREMPADLVDFYMQRCMDAGMWILIGEDSNITHLETASSKQDSDHSESDYDMRDHEEPNQTDQINTTFSDGDCTNANNEQNEWSRVESRRSPNRSMESLHCVSDNSSQLSLTLSLESLTAWMKNERDRKAGEMRRSESIPSLATCGEESKLASQQEGGSDTDTDTDTDTDDNGFSFDFYPNSEESPKE